MSHTAPSANAAALSLLRIALTLIATVASMFLLVQLGPSLPYGKTLLILSGLGGGALLLAGFLRLARDLAQPLQAKSRHQNIGH